MPTGKEEPLAKLTVTVGVTQLSVAVGAIQVTLFAQIPGVLSTKIFEGHDVNTGAFVSFTLTVNEHVAILPAASAALYITTLVPTGNVEPLGNNEVSVTVAVPHLSVAVGAAQEATPEQVPPTLFTTILLGQKVKTGACKSATVTVKEQEEELPDVSDAV